MCEEDDTDYQDQLGKEFRSHSESGGPQSVKEI